MDPVNIKNDLEAIVRFLEDRCSMAGTHVRDIYNERKLELAGRPTTTYVEGVLGCALTNIPKMLPVDSEGDEVYTFVTLLRRVDDDTWDIDKPVVVNITKGFVTDDVHFQPTKH